MTHRLNMEVDLQSLFGLHATWCAQLYSLAEISQLPPSPRIWTRITRASLVRKYRRHLFVTPWYGHFCEQPVLKSENINTPLEKSEEANELQIKISNVRYYVSSFCCFFALWQERKWVPDKLLRLSWDNNIFLFQFAAGEEERGWWLSHVYPGGQLSSPGAYCQVRFL